MIFENVKSEKKTNSIFKIRQIHAFFFHINIFWISREPLMGTKNVSFSSHLGKRRQEWKGSLPRRESSFIVLPSGV